MAELIQCIYASAASPNLSEPGIAELLKHAREKNANLGLTGMLLYCDRSFFQVLEGPQNIVDEIYDTIERDSRHIHITKIIREPIPNRCFEQWTMGFTRVTQEELGRLTDSNDFFTNAGSLISIGAGRSKKLLTAFRKGRWRLGDADARLIA